MIRPATPADERALRAPGPRDLVLARKPRAAPPPIGQFELDGVLVAELDDGIAGYVQLGPALADRVRAHVLEIKGSRSTRAPPPRRRPALLARRDRAGPRRDGARS